MKKNKSKPKLDSNWKFFMELNCCKGMWPAAYYMDGLNFWPCGKIDEDKCDCELCTDMAQGEPQSLAPKIRWEQRLQK